MARQAEPGFSSRNRAKEASRRSVMKASGHSRHVEFISPAARRRTPISESSKKKSKVSATALFGKNSTKAKIQSERREHRHPSPEHEFISNIKGGLEDAHTHIESATKNSLSEIHRVCEARLANPDLATASFVDFISKNYSELSLPLAQEKIQTTFKNQNGKKVPKIEEIGGRVAAFRSLVDRENIKLKDYWKQWDDVQRQFYELGRNVLGDDAFATSLSSEPQPTENTFKHALALIALGHFAGEQEIREEIDELGPDIMEKMKASERKLTIDVKSEQAKLIHAIMGDL